jgi:NADH-quinone oxidoreductase E subunit
MQLPPALEAKFNDFVGRYPVKRSALIPMMLYAQDHFGSLSDELLEEIGKRLDLNLLQVTETLAYYSMLRRRPAGRYHIQVCTNISCMARGASEIYQHVQRRLAIGNREVSETGTFSLEEVECMGACTGAPAMQVNYDFYENLDPDKVDAILEQLQDGKRPEPVPVISGALHDRHPAEVAVVSKHFGIPGVHRIEVYLKHEGYQALERALKQMTPEQIIDEVKKSSLRGRGGAGFPTGLKWSFVPKGSSKPKYVLANGDESEPGTSKDRPLMEMDPHQLIEGMVIAGRAIGSQQGYIYIRGEYRYIIDITDKAITEAYRAGYLGKNILGSGDSHWRRGLRMRRGIGIDGVARG